MTPNQQQRDSFQNSPLELRRMIHHNLLAPILEGCGLESAPGGFVFYPCVRSADEENADLVWDSNLVLLPSYIDPSYLAVCFHQRHIHFSVHKESLLGSSEDKAAFSRLLTTPGISNPSAWGSVYPAPMHFNALVLTSRQIYQETMSEFHMYTRIICCSAAEFVRTMSHLHACGTLDLVRSIRIDFCLFSSAAKRKKLQNLVATEFSNWESLTVALQPNFLRLACPKLEEVVLWFDPWRSKEPGPHSYPSSIKAFIRGKFVPKVSGCRVRRASVLGIKDSRLVKKLEAALTTANRVEDT